MKITVLSYNHYEIEGNLESDKVLFVMRNPIMNIIESTHTTFHLDNNGSTTFSSSFKKLVLYSSVSIWIIL